MYFVIYILCFVVAAKAGPATETVKNQYCTDPRTMQKHAAYTEWADAYSCTRHRCQPGGRNLAIYTVGCKRVEPPESAIECEEVVEDTNMQFPYCCTRLRCLVVVRGEVWTRVLGQPWETLPAAPWSHMYKMKKPPPTDTTFLPKTGEGPVYELAGTPDEEADKIMRASKATTSIPGCNDIAPRANPTPDIVIALDTNKEEKPKKGLEILRRKQTSKLLIGRAEESSPPERAWSSKIREAQRWMRSNGGASNGVLQPRKKRIKKATSRPFINQEIDDDAPESHNEIEIDEMHTTEKGLESSNEKYFESAFAVVTPKPPSKKSKSRQIVWTEVPPGPWSDHEPSMDVESPRARMSQETSIYHQADIQSDIEKKDEKPSNLQALVDAIGTRMRDIESVVQRMSQKVHRSKPEPHPFINEAISGERRSDIRLQTRKHLAVEPKEHENDAETKIHSSPDVENYIRSSKRSHSTTETVSEQPIFVEDTNMNGYLSDVSSNIVRRAGTTKEHLETYMAPVENRPKTMVHALALDSAELEKAKKKKRAHKKKKAKIHKKHHIKSDSKKRFNRVHSTEIGTNVVSLEDSSSVVV